MADAPYKLGRHDRRILALVCRTNGGGIDLTGEPHAPQKRLREAGLIQRKSHPHAGCQPWVHTPAGLALHRSLMESPHAR